MDWLYILLEKWFGASFRTTAFAVVGMLTILIRVAGQLLDGDPATNPDWGTEIPQLLAAIGLLFARDNKVSSEKAGAIK